MKSYLNRQSIYAVIFIAVLFSFSIKNIMQEYPILSQTLQGLGSIDSAESLKSTIKHVDKNINDELLWK